ncbi:MAG: hypothetical protein HKL86_01145 [Acidimicrobiaceae bacterium]|nr:hypothetical protein [Acidimicrobiaceae bacterium]
MCLLIFAWKLHDEFALCVGANRDERLDRPAKSFTVLRAQNPRTVGGRDLLAGGTWLANNEFGVVAGLTNTPLPQGRDLTKRSRGELPIMLTGFASAAEGVEELLRKVQPGQYNPAWLLVADREDLFYVALDDGERPRVRALAPGLHILENSPLELQTGKTNFVEQALSMGVSDGSLLWNALAPVLSSHALIEPTAEELSEPRAISRARETRSPCVHTNGYGTRSSTMIRIATNTAAMPEILVSDGPPCTTAFEDVTTIW